MLAASTTSDASSRRGALSTGQVVHFRSRPDLEPPVVHVTTDSASVERVSAGGYVFATPGGPMILEAGGEPVWYRPVPHYSTNLRVQRLSGQPVLTWWQGRVASYGVADFGECFVLDSHYREVTRVRATNGLQPDLHEFVIAPDGTGYFTSYQVVTADLSAIGGPTRAKMLESWIRGVDLATGKVVFGWRSSDHIDLTESYRAYTGSSTAPFTPVHVNSIDPLPDGNLLVSARHTWTIYKVDRSTGEILWRLGGKKSDFTLGPGVHFAWQHDAKWHPGNVLSIFDNESPPPEATQSRGLVVQVTERKRTVTLVHAYYHPGKPLLVAAQGSVEFLPNGDVFMGWGFGPYFTQYHHDGKAILDGRFEKYNSYRAFRTPWRGMPVAPPAVAVERRSKHGLRVYASWNGATEVERWSVLGGPTRRSLSTLGAGARSGFETAIDVPAPADAHFVAAKALDRGGHVLGTSPATRV